MRVCAFERRKGQMKLLTGIGSRETPESICEEMTKLGAWAKSNQIYVRSGHADGADWAFEVGARESCIVYLPWRGFNNKLEKREDTNAKYVIVPDDEKYTKITREFHPRSDMLSAGGRKLMNRNACQILGINLDSPTECVVCYTSDWQKPSGGTSQALRIADHYKIPIINMSKYPTMDQVLEQMKKEGLSV